MVKPTVPCHGSGGYSWPSHRRPALDSRLVLVGFVVDEVALGQVFLHVLVAFPSQYHSTGSSCLSVHLSLTLYNLTI
jgi:hypothetical protein